MVAGFYLSKYKLAPLVIVCHCLHEIFTSLNQSSNWFAQAIIARLERSMMKRADYLISPSVNLRQIIMRRHRLAGARFEVIPNPVDTDLFVPKPVSTNIPTVLYVGRLERLKGVYVLAEAIGLLARSYKDFRCIFIGRDSLTRDGRSVRAELSSKLERLGCLNQVQFIDHLERSHLVPYYQQADLCVVPSLYETCPYTVLEAMACGRPVVATNVGGIPEIIEDGLTGRLVPKEDSDQLAETIRELLSNPLERERLGKNARVHIEKHYSREVIARRYADLLERVINVSSVEAALL
jgi:glycosyltransferase involved in cell wall biosynthesis